MSIFLRIWGVFAVVLMLGAYFTVNVLQQQIKPSVKKAIEDTLADNANLLAALLADELKSNFWDIDLSCLMFYKNIP